MILALGLSQERKISSHLEMW